MGLLVSTYFMSKMSCPLLYSKLLYKNGQDFLDMQYAFLTTVFQDGFVVGESEAVMWIRIRSQTAFISVRGSRGMKWREFFFVIINYIFQEPKKVAYLRFRYRFDNIFFSTLLKDGLKSIWFRMHQILWIRIPIQSMRIHITGLIYTDIFASLTNVTVEIKN